MEGPPEGTVNKVAAVTVLLAIMLVCLLVIPQRSGAHPGAAPR
jgi:hypothetical protein